MNDPVKAPMKDPVTPVVPVAMIAALAQNNAIGINNKMPWHLPADLRYFKAVTLGKPVVMGRKTFDSLGRPLPGRSNIVITRDRHYRAEGIQVVHSLEQALSLAGHIAQGQAEEVMVIGGAEIYRQALLVAQRLYLTRVAKHFAGDAFFPELEPQAWRLVSREDHLADSGQPLAYSFQVLERC